MRSMVEGPARSTTSLVKASRKHGSILGAIEAWK